MSENKYTAADFAAAEFDLTEFLDVVHYEVESKHGVLGTQCRCGFESFVKRDMTKHIVTETLIAAGLEARDGR